MMLVIAVIYILAERSLLFIRTKTKQNKQKESLQNGIFRAV